MRAVVYTARWVFTDERSHLDRGGFVVARGRVVRILSGRGAVTRAARGAGVELRDQGEVALAPGFVDAHAHLELSVLRGRLPRAASFVNWIRALVRERRSLSPSELEASAREGARLLVASGTTCVGDVDSTGASERALRRGGLRARLYREVLDAGDPQRGARALSHAARRFRSTERLHPGVSPHAPYTAEPKVLEGARALCTSRGWPASIHWAETEEEIEWLASRQGPFRTLFASQARGGAGGSGGRSKAAGGRAGGRGGTGLDAIASAGLLTPTLSLVHANHPALGEIRRVARSGATIVHCPGTHAFFQRERFDLAGWLDARVRVALGTDGLSSNDALDMRRELALVRAAHPWLSPERAFEMATRAGARSLGFEGRAGEITDGAWADFVAHGFEGLSAKEWGRPRALLDALTHGRTSIASVRIAGRLAGPTAEFRSRTSESLRRGAE